MKLITDTQIILFVYAHHSLSEQEIEILSDFLSEDPFDLVRGQDEKGNYSLRANELSQTQNYAWTDSKEDEFLKEFFQKLEEEIKTQKTVHEITLYLASEKSNFDL